MQVDITNVEYAGFGVRFLASVLDSIVQLLVIVPVAWMLFGSDFFMNPDFEGGPAVLVINWVFPALYSILFWKYRSATPGKIWMGIMLIDARTGGVPDIGKLLLRFVGYIVCGLTLFLGFLLIFFDKRKRGLHDMIAGTAVIKTPSLEAVQESRHFTDR
jgi:uncharacterized RDD family membrane protein YckC